MIVSKKLTAMCAAGVLGLVSVGSVPMTVFAAEQTGGDSVQLATEKVRALFTDENENEILKTVNQNDVDMANNVVTKLSYGDAVKAIEDIDGKSDMEIQFDFMFNGQQSVLRNDPKYKLQRKVNEARYLLNKRVKDDLSKELQLEISKLFSNDQQSLLSIGVTQKNIDDLKEKLSQLDDSDLKIGLNNQLKAAEELLNENKIETTYDSNSKDNKIVTEEFKDENLKKEMMNIIGKQQITIGDLKKLSGDLVLKDKGIANLEGLQYCSRITGLNLSGNNLDYSNGGIFDVLSMLKKLTTLDLSNTGMYSRVNSDNYMEGLQNLTDLTTLNLSENKISDLVTLKQMWKLKVLNLDHNEIMDISPLKFLHNLNKLSLNYQIRQYGRETNHTGADVNKDDSMSNPVVDENGQIVPINERNIFIKNSYGVYDPIVKYNKEQNKISWNYNAYDGKCYSPWEPLVMFKKQVKIGAAETLFVGGFYLGLSTEPDNIQDKFVYNRAKTIVEKTLDEASSTDFDRINS